MKIFCLAIPAALILIAVGCDRGTAPATTTHEAVPSTNATAATVAQSAVDQSNVLNQAAEMIAEKDAENKTVDIACVLKVLKDLRTGNTNEAIDLLETKLDDALVGYETLPRLTGAESLIEQTRQYRMDFPRTTGNTNVDSAVARALNAKLSP